MQQHLEQTPFSVQSKIPRSAIPETEVAQVLMLVHIDSLLTAIEAAESLAISTDETLEVVGQKTRQHWNISRYGKKLPTFSDEELGSRLCKESPPWLATISSKPLHESNDYFWSITIIRCEQSHYSFFSHDDGQVQVISHYVKKVLPVKDLRNHEDNVF